MDLESSEKPTNQQQTNSSVKKSKRRGLTVKKTTHKFKGTSRKTIIHRSDIVRDAESSTKEAKELHPNVMNDADTNTKKSQKRPFNILDDDSKSKTKKIKKCRSDIIAKSSTENPQNRRSDTIDETKTSELVLPKTKNEKNAERRVKNKIKELQRVCDPHEQACTVFVGNLPTSVKKDKLKKFFSKYGEVDSVRIRGVAVADPKTPKKIAYIQAKFHPQRNSFSAYVKFATPEGAAKAAADNGIVYKDHHLRLQCQNKVEKQDETKAIFVGNLSFNAEDDDLWQCFEGCGAISSVRIVRDPATMMAKGFGYVNFQNTDSVQLALEMEDVMLKGKTLRISACNVRAANKNKRKSTVKKIRTPGRPKKPRNLQPAHKEETDGKDEESGAIQNNNFQGSKFTNKKKKPKLNKSLQQKKRMVKILAPRT